MSCVKLDLKVYLVRNQEGQFFRAKGFAGTGNSWVENAVDAKVYLKLGQARSRVTFFANNYPDYGTPEIIEVTCTQGCILDETKRVLKAVKKINDEKYAHARRKLDWQKSDLDRKQAALDRERATLDARQH